MKRTRVDETIFSSGIKKGALKLLKLALLTNTSHLDSEWSLKSRSSVVWKWHHSKPSLPLVYSQNVPLCHQYLPAHNGQRVFGRHGSVCTLEPFEMGSTKEFQLQPRAARYIPASRAISAGRTWHVTLRPTVRTLYRSHETVIKCTPASTVV